MTGQQLASLSVLYRSISSVTRLAWALVFITFGSQSAGFGLPVVVGVVVAGLLLAAGYQYAYYRRFTYELTPDTFDIDSGVLSRRTREIPYRRIQNVDVSSNVVQRALGIAQLNIETAGGSDTEAQLRYVTETEADRLREELSRRKRGEAGEAGGPDDEEAARREPDLLFASTPRELALLGATSVDLRLLSLVTVVLPVLAPSLAGGPRPRDPLVALAFSAPVLAVGVVLLSALVSGAISVTNYWGFRLLRAGDELRYQRGLLQRYSGTIPLSKVQSVTVSENAIARRLGYASLTVETAGYAPGESGGSQSAVPIAERERVVSLARSVEPFEEFDFQRPPKRARTRYAVRYALVVLVLTGVAFAVVRFTRFSFAWFGLLGFLGLAPVAAHLKWRNLGYALLEDHVVTREGFFTRTSRVVPYYRVQTVVESATVFQRRRDLATVVVDTAGSSGLTGRDARALDIDAEDATEFRRAVEDRLQDSLVERRTRRGRRAGRAPRDDVTPAD